MLKPSFWLLLEVGEGLAYSNICALKSDGTCNGTKATICMSFVHTVFDASAKAWQEDPVLMLVINILACSRAWPLLPGLPVPERYVFVVVPPFRIRIIFPGPNELGVASSLCVRLSIPGQAELLGKKLTSWFAYESWNSFEWAHYADHRWMQVASVPTKATILDNIGKSLNSCKIGIRDCWAWAFQAPGLFHTHHCCMAQRVPGAVDEGVDIPSLLTYISSSVLVSSCITVISLLVIILRSSC